jgi:hypothetical protein
MDQKTLNLASLSSLGLEFVAGLFLVVGQTGLPHHQAIRIAAY